MPLKCPWTLLLAIDESGLQTFFRDEATFEELSPSEPQLRNSFETDQIYWPWQASQTHFQSSGSTR